MCADHEYKATVGSTQLKRCAAYVFQMRIADNCVVCKLET